MVLPTKVMQDFVTPKGLHVPHHDKLTQNLYYNYYYPKPTDAFIRHLDRKR